MRSTAAILAVAMLSRTAAFIAPASRGARSLAPRLFGTIPEGNEPMVSDFPMSSTMEGYKVAFGTHSAVVCNPSTTR